VAHLPQYSMCVQVNAGEWPATGWYVVNPQTQTAMGPFSRRGNCESMRHPEDYCTHAVRP